MADNCRAEILVNGLVQGVGFRFFVITNAERIGVTGFTKNLYTGEVLTVVEGARHQIEEIYEKIKVGPMHAQVKRHSIIWHKYTGEFKRFGVKY